MRGRPAGAGLWAIVLCAAALPLAGARAAVEGVLVGNGDRITTDISSAVDTDSFTVGLGAGGKLTVTVAATKGSLLLPALRLFDPQGTEVPVATLLKGVGKKKITLKSFPVPADGTGTWKVVVSGNGTSGGYAASFKVLDVKTLVRKGLLVPDGQQVAVEVPTVAGATFTGTLKVRAGTAPETALFREDAAAGGGAPLAPPTYAGGRAPAADPAVGTRLRDASSFVLGKDGGAGDCTCDLTIKLKLPKVPRRKVFLAPEAAVATVSPGLVRQEGAPHLVLGGAFLEGDPSPRLLPTDSGADAADPSLAVTASAYSGSSSVDPLSGATISTGATLDLALAPDAAFGARDLLYVPPPLLGEPVRLADALVVRAPVPSVAGTAPLFVRQEDGSDLVTVTGTGFRAGGALSFSGPGIVAGATTVDSATQATVSVAVAFDATVGARDATFTQPAAGGSDAGTGTGLLTVKNPVPTVASASPSVVKQEDTALVVTITGTGFRTGGSLSVSGTGITVGTTTVVNATTATAPFTVAPDAPIGARDVTYTQPAAGGSDAASGTGILTVDYPDPVVTSVAPSFLRQLDAAATVTLTGTGFRAGGTVTISGAGLTLGATSVGSATSVTVPVTVDVAATVGARDVTFTQSGGGGAAGTKTGGLAIRNPVPTLASVSPGSITQGNTGVTLTLTGTNFRSGGSVSAGSGITVTGTSFLSATQFTATVDADIAAALGLHDVVYTQPVAGGGDSVTKTNALQVNAPNPTVASVTSATVKQLDAAVARFATGTNFRSGGTLSVSGANVTVGSVVVTGATRVDFTLTATNGAAIGARDVTWAQPASGGGAAATLTGGLTVNFPDPTITSVAPNQIDRGATSQTLTLTGTNFRAGGTVGVSGSGVTLSSPSWVSDTTFNVVYSVDVAATLGLRDVTYTHGGGGGASTTKTSAVQVMPVGVDLSSLAPAAWLPGTARFRCVATGANFNSGTATAVSGSGVTVHSTTFDSATQLTLELSVDSSAALGARDVTITPGSGGGSAKTFTGAAVIAAAGPRVDSISTPTLAQGASSVAVTILGSGFRSGDTPTASGTNVSFASVSVVDPGKITASATVNGGAATGFRDLTVAHGSSDGGLSGTLLSAFKVIAATPTVSAVNPSKVGRTGSGGATRQVPITITGTNFMSGATLTVSRTASSGVSVVSQAVASDTLMTAVLSVTGTATTGTWDLQVVNPSSLGNSGSSGNGLLDLKDENTLCVNQVIASSGSAYGGEKVTIQGSGFTTAATADFGTVTAAGTYVMDKGTIVTTVPIPSGQSTTAPRVVDVKVTLSGGSTSATLTGGYAYAKDDVQFRVRSTFPAQGATGVPMNLVSAVARLSAPADPATGSYGTTFGTNVFWFEGNGSFVSGGLRGFGPGGRTLVFSRTGGGTLPIASAGLYVLDIPVTLKSLGGNAFSPTRLQDSTQDQYTFTISSSTTDSTAPTLSSIVPANTATAVDVTAGVKITFSEEIDPLTVTSSNITFKQGGTTIAADYALSDDLRTVTITPKATLAVSTTYTTNATASVKDLCGNAFTNTSWTFTTGTGTDGTAPVIDAVVLEGLPSDMDGSGTYVNSSGTGGIAFDAYLPQFGWLVEVKFSDSGGSGIDVNSFSAKASVAVAGSSANAELASNFTVTPTGASWRIPTSGFASGDNATFTFNVKDLATNSATASTVTIDVISKDSAAVNGGDLDPMDARQTWILRGDIDAYTATYSTSSGQQGVTTTVASNGIPDLDEALRLVGLNTGSMTTDAANTRNGNETGTNAILKRMFLTRLRETLNARYLIAQDGVHGADSVDIEFLLPGEQGSLASMPTYSASNSFNSAKAFSEMSLGGTLGADSSAFSSGSTLAQAWFDTRNLSQEANLNFGVGGSTTGIYLLGMLKLEVNDSTTTTIFGSRVGAKFVTVRGGTPAGEGALDDDVLAGAFDRTSGGNTAGQNQRYDDILDAIELTALYASAVTAHEIGHSTGLVPDGAPKTGLFGNAHFNNTFTEATSTSPNTSHHLDFLGNDIMAAATSFESAVQTGADFKRFSPMDIAYLRNRLVHDEGK